MRKATATSAHPARCATAAAIRKTWPCCRQVAGKGKPVVTVLVSGRPLWVNDLMNLSDSFIAAWLPGTEGKGVSDLLVRQANGGQSGLQRQAVVLLAEDGLPDAAERRRRQLRAAVRLRLRPEEGRKRSQLGKLDAGYPAGGCGKTERRSAVSARPTAPASRCRSSQRRPRVAAGRGPERHRSACRPSRSKPRRSTPSRTPSWSPGPARPSWKRSRPRP
jgi:hypothetical protein